MTRSTVLLVVLAAALASSCATRSVGISGGAARFGMGGRSRAAPHSDQRPMSSTVIGPENPLLAQGAEALQAGRPEDGIRLTQEGLKRPSPVHDLAAGHANLCAGYVLLRRYDEALTECNIAIALDQTNWRAYNNRAAVFSAQGLYELAVEDIKTGLRLAPDSAVLQQSLVIIHRNEALQRHHRRFASNA